MTLHPKTDETADVDVLVVGGGPAGLATALRLRALDRSVLVLERSMYSDARVGEHLSVDGEEALRELRVWDAVRKGPHLESPGVVSVWGDERAIEVAGIFRPSGGGTHLARPAFERELHRALEARDGRALLGVDQLGAEPDTAVWRVSARSGGRRLAIRARYLVDASGRSGHVGRIWGAAPVRRDTLIGIAAHVEVASRQMPLVEAVEGGWWYSACLPHDEDGEGSRMVAIYFTDVDLRPRGPLDEAWRTALDTSEHTRQRVERSGAVERPRGFAAHSQCLRTPARPATASSPGWVAVGDAAMAMDPLSSAGLASGLRGGIAAADAVHEALAGSEGALARYAEDVLGAFRSHRRLRRRYYGMERRFTQSAFWRRRHRALAEDASIWLDVDASLHAAADAEAFATTLRGLAPDLEATWVRGLALPAMLARELARSLRARSGYDDAEIVTVLQELVSDGCLRVGSATSLSRDAH